MYRIFIVEDDAAIAGVIRRHLEGWGYTVRCAQRIDDVLSEIAAIDQQRYQEARELMRSCKKVILAVSGIGTMNRRNEELKNEAESLGILEK